MTVVKRATLAGLALALAGVVWTWPEANAAGRVIPEPVAAWEAPPVDVARLKAEDEANRNRKDLPWRIGFPMVADLAPASAGTWVETAGGAQVWRLEVRSPGALWLVLGFSVFELQPGARLHVLDATGRRVLGPFGVEHRRTHGQLWLPPIAGDSVLLELEWPPALRGVAPGLRLGTVSHGYRPWTEPGASPDHSRRSLTSEAAASGSCNVDVACPEGVGWESQARSVVRMLSGGFAFCTGTLINNTAADCTPYVLTAAHCSPNAASTTFQFGYQRSVCGAGTIETTHTVTGSTVVASHAPTDMLLLRIDDPVPSEFDAHFAGWNRSTSAATRATTIHHPQGDPKKISHNDDALITATTGSGPTHWRVTEWEIGTTEPGSSGAPLFDQNGLCIGQLTGGQAACGNALYDDFGKLALSWNGGGTPQSRLRDWLDPLGNLPLSVAGLDASVCAEPHPALGLASWSIDDSGGNGNGTVDPGETIDLFPALENNGSAAATQVAGVLETATPLVSVTVPDGVWPDLAVAQLAPPAAPLRFVVDPGIACGETISLRLDATAAEAPGLWVSQFDVSVGQSAGTTTVFADDLESGTAAWLVQSLVGSNPWALSSGRSQSPTHSWFVRDLSTIADSVLVLVPTAPLASRATLSFSHWVASEAGFDGGVLEYSTNSGASWSDAGALITANGYNLAISTDWGSPLGGRMSWSGNLTPWRTVTVDLSSLAGSTPRFRWRFASDSVTGADGWYVDDIVLSAPHSVCARLDDLDLDGNGSPDIVWRDADTGEVGAWLMQGTTLAGWAGMGTEPSPNWQIQGLGDFDRDGDGDVLWRNTVTGGVGAWLLDGTRITGWAGMPTEPVGSGWNIQGVGDFNHDGSSDVLWRNAVTGQVGAWLMDGPALASWAWMPTEPAASGWRIQGVGDFTRDGYPDVLWRHDQTGEVGAWIMDGTTLAGWVWMPTESPASGWQIRSVVDLTGDRGVDVVWRHGPTGQVGAWIMDGTTLAGWTWLPTEAPASGWEIQGPR